MSQVEHGLLHAPAAAREGTVSCSQDNNTQSTSAPVSMNNSNNTSSNNSHVSLSNPDPVLLGQSQNMNTGQNQNQNQNKGSGKGGGQAGNIKGKGKGKGKVKGKVDCEGPKWKSRNSKGTSRTRRAAQFRRMSPPVTRQRANSVHGGNTCSNKRREHHDLEIPSGVESEADAREERRGQPQAKRRKIDSENNVEQNDVAPVVTTIRQPTSPSAVRHTVFDALQEHLVTHVHVHQNSNTYADSHASSEPENVGQQVSQQHSGQQISQPHHTASTSAVHHLAPASNVVSKSSMTTSPQAKLSKSKTLPKLDLPIAAGSPSMIPAASPRVSRTSTASLLGVSPLSPTSGGVKNAMSPSQHLATYCEGKKKNVARYNAERESATIQRKSMSFSPKNTNGNLDMNSQIDLKKQIVWRVRKEYSIEQPVSAADESARELAKEAEKYALEILRARFGDNGLPQRENDSWSHLLNDDANRNDCHPSRKNSVSHIEVRKSTSTVGTLFGTPACGPATPKSICPPAINLDDGVISNSMSGASGTNNPSKSFKPKPVTGFENFFHRKSKRVVLAVLQIERQDEVKPGESKYIYVKG